MRGPFKNWSRLLTAAIIALLVCPFASLSDEAVGIDTNDNIDFDAQIAPIFTKHCTDCHGSQTKKIELDVSSVESILRGSESGEVISVSDPESSRLLEVLVDGEMPPEDEGQGLSTKQVELIRRWIIQFSNRKTAAVTLPSPPADQHGVLPILLAKCAECHGGQLQEAGLDVRNLESLLKGGKSGPAIHPGDAVGSLMLQRIKRGEMPPKSKLAKYSVKPVTAGELQRLQQWVSDGANWNDAVVEDLTEIDSLVSDADRQHWAFQTPIKPSLPTLAPDKNELCRNPIDRFIAHRLHSAGIGLSPAADRATLARRLSFDLLGLPPTPEISEAFCDDNHPDAYDALVDRLLASPAYGERWGQYWLDVAGYADSEGVQHADPIRPHAYRYRDYVIQAFNQDKPYDRFLVEQIAGDELADYENAPQINQQLYDNLVATGFLRMTSDGTFAGITGFLPNRLDVIDDQIRVLSSAVMGVTIRCARCHSHKFDPLPQRDYYRLAAIFKGAMDEFNWLRPLDNPSAGNSRYLPYVTTAEREAWLLAESELTAQIDSQKLALKQLEQLSPGDDDGLTKYESRKQAIEAKIRALERSRRPEPKIRALWDSGDPSPTYLLQRGDYRRPAREVQPGVPSMLTGFSGPIDPKPPWSSEQSTLKKTGNRLAMARWLTDPAHPLTARVIVNRVWKHHFGRGIHEPLDDFGKASQPPSHPELLNWLAVRFVEERMSIKWLHRLILTSATYRQSSAVSDRQMQVDPENRLLSRMPLRRLEAEVLRDTLIAVAGVFDREQFGPSTPLESRSDGLVTSKSINGAYRRSIYVQKRRTQRLTILDNFDRPRMSPNCVDRTVSNVAPQALHLMNNRMVRDLSERFAARVMAEVGDDQQKQITRMYQIAIGRRPTPAQEAALLTAYQQLTAAWKRGGLEQAESSSAVSNSQDLGSQSATALNSTALNSTAQDSSRQKAETQTKLPLANLCHALMNSAAFLYVD